MTNQRIRSRPTMPARQRGVTLIELMVAMVLGLVVSGAALALFMTNRQTYVASENMDRIQEASRIAFELMARDLREADGNPCSNKLVPDNQISGATTPYAWWSDWGAGMLGYTGATPFADDGFGTTERKRVAGTPAIESWDAVPTGSVVKTDQALTSSDLDVTSTTGTGIASGDILMICDYTHGTIFQASSVAPNTIQHHTGGTPGNTAAAFDVSAGIYLKNAVISKLHPVRWYIGYNGRKDQDGNDLTSLYRTTLNSGGAAKPLADEIVPGVTGMDLLYLVNGGASYTATPATWADVFGVQVTLTYTGHDKISSSKTKLQRQFTNVVALRSRAQ